VAGFIGSPAMNFLPCTIPADGAGELRGRSFRLTVSIPTPPAGAWPGQLLLGIRPQDIDLVSVAEGDLRGRVEVVEPLGSELLAHVKLPEEPTAEPLRVVAPIEAGVAEGTETGIRLRRDRLHLFDRDSGVRV
jgi:ABC-type sugar transport system ATPase subunit